MKYLTILLGLLVMAACSKELNLASKYAQPNNAEDAPEEQPEEVKEWNQYQLSEAYTINQQGIDLEGYWPDGKLCVLPASNGGGYICFWAEKYSYRTEASSTRLEDHVSQVTVENRVFGQGITDIDGFSDGGSWFIGIHRLAGNKLVGFFHAESHWKTGSGAYKSLGVAYSEDEGRTWTKGDKFLSTNVPKPEKAAWCGLGDGCVVYNPERKQYICYYSANDGVDYRICMAVSSDSQGAAHTWQKWDGKEFTVEGCNADTQLGGKDVSIEALSKVAGANPSVLWNSYLERWVMVYSSWSGSIYMSSSKDGIAWETPIKVFENSGKVTYPNLIGISGDSEADKTLRLYYGDAQKDNGIRNLVYRTIEYK